MLINQVLLNAPIEVSFAGLTGTTMSMQRLGWELSLESMVNHRFGHGYSYRLAGRHRGMNLRALSYPMEVAIEPTRMHEAHRMMHFNLHIVAENIIFNVAEMATPSFLSVDFSSPEFIDIPTSSMNKHISLDECAFFKTYNKENESTVYIPKDEIWTTTKHLKAIKELQKDRQDELFKKYREKEYRENNNDGKSVNSEIAFQLVSV